MPSRECLREIVSGNNLDLEERKTAKKLAQLQIVQRNLRERRRMERRQQSDAPSPSPSPSPSSSPSPSPSPSPSSCKRSASSVSLEDFELLQLLGRGAYGKVFQVRKQGGRDDGDIYALKSVSKRRVSKSCADLRHTRTERDVLVRVNHPFLIRVHYTFETTHRLYFAQEFMRGGELYRLMETEGMLLEPEAKFYLCEILLALEYLHSLNIIYRDLKTENVMLDSTGHIKLIDFGLSKMLGSEGDVTKTFCGTVDYMAPEVVLKSPGHSFPADWWSFGILAFDLLTGRPPFHSVRGKKETKERILSGRFKVPPFITREAGDFIRRLLRKRVERRLGSGPGGAEQVKSHPFFTDVDWSQVKRRECSPPRVPELRDPADPADVSQFDPCFTSASPRESACEEVKDGGALAEPCGCSDCSKMFDDFDYVSADVGGGGDGHSRGDGGGGDGCVVSRDDEEGKEESAVVEATEDLNIRDHGN